MSNTTDTRSPMQWQMSRLSYVEYSRPLVGQFRERQWMRSARCLVMWYTVTKSSPCSTYRTKHRIFPYRDTKDTSSVLSPGPSSSLGTLSGGGSSSMGILDFSQFRKKASTKSISLGRSSGVKKID